MASAIGIRVYRIAVHERGNPALLPLDSDRFTRTVPAFIKSFIASHSHIQQNSQLERSWYFEEKNEDAPGSSQGYVHYGTFGFESNFVDTATKRHNYRRKITDIEEIPLFFEFWCPEDSKFAFVAFQSFQGRSCIHLVVKAMKEAFEGANTEFYFNVRKIMPNDARGSAFYSAPVKNLRLIRRQVSSDFADRYFNNPNPDPIDVQVIMSARRKRDMGDLASLIGSLRSGPRSVVTYDGIDFPEAVAEVRVGRGLRRVGVMGYNKDAGVIDLTDAVERGADGHPTFASMTAESDAILRDFYETMAGDQE